jgi:membrane associated rhomboid family serine protease
VTGVTTEQPTEPETTVCYRHPDRETRLACSDCGRPICPACSIDAAVGQKCPQCVGEVGRQKTIDVRASRGVTAGIPPVTKTIIAVTALIFFLGSGIDDYLVHNSALVAAGEWWRIFTTALLHASLTHILFNMWALYALGPLIERSVGSGPFIALYLAAAGMGGVAAQFFTPGLFNAVGASGAVFGLFGVWLNLAIRRRNTAWGRFAHLHLHTEYSMLDGAARVADVVAAVVADGQPGVAVTDHGVLYGAVDFYTQAKAAGVTPVIGMEGYLTPGSRFDRPPRRDDIRYHITLLAVNQEGYRNLVKLASAAYLEGFYYKPRLDVELLNAHCRRNRRHHWLPGGHVPKLLAPEASEEEGRGGGQRDFRACRRGCRHVSGHLREGELLRRDHGSRRSGAEGRPSRPGGGGERGGGSAARHQRLPTTRERRRLRLTTPSCASKPAPRWTRRTASPSRAPAIT